LPATLTDPRTAKLNDLVDQFTGRLKDTPDLAKAGLDQLAGLREQTAEDRQKGIQDIGRSAAAFGRIGSGVTTGQLGDLEALLQKRQIAAETGLAGDLARQQGDETRANVATASGLQGQSYGQSAEQGNEAFNREVQLQQLIDQLTNSQFGRSATAAQFKLAGASGLDTQAGASASGASDLTSTLAYLRALQAKKAPAPYTMA
jgi:hypothetical protein